jgi:AcrR family transcriptional regulator
MAKQVDHEQILDSARRVLAARGPQATTLEEIAEEAGISRVTLYRRGATRESILAELADRAAEEYRRALWPALTSRAPAGERLEVALKALCDVAEENLALLLGLGAGQGPLFNDPQSDANAQVVTRDVFTEPLERIIGDGQADGSIAAGDPLATASLLFSLVGQTYMHERSVHRRPAEQTRDGIVSIVLHGVLTAGGKRGERR